MIGFRRFSLHAIFHLPSPPHLTVLLVLAACQASPCLAAETKSPSSRPPNIVLIVSDDQGYADLGVTNREVITPALDRLAREGVRLTNFYVSWPACTPSRASLLTGRYPQRNGMYDMVRNEAPDYGHRYTPAEYEVTFERIGGLDEREVLLPELLHQAGYRCGIFGKWDLGIHRRFLPLQRGWDDFYGFVNTGIDYFTHERYGVPSMFDGNAPTEADKGTYSTDLFRREAVRFLRENKDHPFLLYLPFNAPHGASSLDFEVRGAAQGADRHKQLYPHLEDNLTEGTRRGQKTRMPSKSKRRLEYLAAITGMDEAIGEVLSFLDEFQLSENTLVIFFSDNGGSGGADNAPLRGHKGQVLEGGIRVCALMRYPGQIPAGSVSSAFLTSLEILPTALGLAGIDPPTDIVLDGYDALPTLRGDAPSPRDEMFWKRRNHEAARVGTWKWIRTEKGEELYDLANDIGERTNLASSEPEKLTELRRAYAKWTAAMQDAEPRGPFRDY